MKMMNIIDGWRNLLLGLENDLAKERSEHCTRCDHAKMGTYEKLIGESKIIEIQGMKCEKCGCPLSAKLRSKNETCPIKKW